MLLCGCRLCVMKVGDVYRSAGGGVSAFSDEAWRVWSEGENGRRFLSADVDGGLENPKERYRRGRRKTEYSLYAPVGGFFGVGAADIRDFLEGAGGADVTLYIDSPGGEVAAGFAIANQLKRYTGRVTAVVDGMAASIATIVAAAADERFMGAGSMWMIHGPRALVVGTEEDMDGIKRSLSNAKTSLAAEYERIGRRSRKEYRDMLGGGDVWMSKDEAVDEGFVSGGDVPAVNEVVVGGVLSGGVVSSEGGVAVSMTAKERAEFDAAVKGAAEAREAVAAAESAREAAESALEEAKAEAAGRVAAAESAVAAARAEAELDAAVMKYPEGYRAMARLALGAGDADALKPLDALLLRAEESVGSGVVGGVVSSGAEESEESLGGVGVDAESNPYGAFEALVEGHMESAGVGGLEARKHVRGTIEGRRLLAAHRKLRMSGKGQLSASA